MYLVMTKCHLFEEVNFLGTLSKVKIHCGFDVFLLFIFLFRIYFKKAIFVTYNLYRCRILKSKGRYGRTGNAGKSNRTIDSKRRLCWAGGISK
jgi:hypothetical protein